MKELFEAPRVPEGLQSPAKYPLREARQALLQGPLKEIHEGRALLGLHGVHDDCPRERGLGLARQLLEGLLGAFMPEEVGDQAARVVSSQVVLGLLRPCKVPGHLAARG